MGHFIFFDDMALVASPVDFATGAVSALDLGRWIWYGYELYK